MRPASTLDRSRMSLISDSRSLPAEPMVRANSTSRSDSERLVVGEQPGEDQHRVERRTQLVRHVGQELGLVLGGQGELGRLLFQAAPRELDLLVLDLYVAVLRGQLPGLLVQLRVSRSHLVVGAGQRQRVRRDAAGAHVPGAEQAFGGRRLVGVDQHPPGAAESRGPAVRRPGGDRGTSSDSRLLAVLRGWLGSGYRDFTSAVARR